MARWLADKVPEWMTGPLFFVLLPLLVLLVEARVHKKLPHWRIGRHNDATAIMVSVAAVVYSVATGLCVVTLWDRYETARAATEQEATNLAALAEDSRVCDAPVPQRIRAQVLAYNQAVVDGWQLRIHGQPVPGAGIELDAVAQTIRQIRPTNEAQRAFVTDAVTRLGRAVELRQTAIRLARDQQLPDVLWVSVLVGSVVVLGLCLTCGVEDTAVRWILIVGVTVMVAVNLFLVVELNYPFYGEISIKPDDYLAVIAQLRGQT
jgi:hypothetical protein